MLSQWWKIINSVLECSSLESPFNYNCNVPDSIPTSDNFWKFWIRLIEKGLVNSKGCLCKHLLWMISVARNGSFQWNRGKVVTPSENKAIQIFAPFPNLDQKSVRLSDSALIYEKENMIFFSHKKIKKCGLNRRNQLWVALFCWKSALFC